MIAGNATPIDARKMWKPSGNAIWLRAGARCAGPAQPAPRAAASRSHRGGLSGGLVVPVDPGHVRAVQHLRPTAAGEGVRAPGQERVDTVADAGHEPGMDAEPCGVGDVAVQLVTMRSDLG